MIWMLRLLESQVLHLLWLHLLQFAVEIEIDEIYIYISTSNVIATHYKSGISSCITCSNRSSYTYQTQGYKADKYIFLEVGTLIFTNILCYNWDEYSTCILQYHRQRRRILSAPLPHLKSSANSPQ